MEESKAIRESINPAELNILEKLTIELRGIVLNLFICETLSDKESPFRYKYNHKKLEYEFIFSSMGSFTVRPIPNIPNRRTFPIFYLSLGKYSGNFFWENSNQEIIKIEPELLKQEILNAIYKYEASI